MAYWNPFGWSEEERLSIQSIVRPITQVAAVASSLGVSFAGKGATEAGGAAAGVDPPVDPHPIDPPPPVPTPDPPTGPEGLPGTPTEGPTGSLQADPTGGQAPTLPNDMSIPKAQHGIDITMQGSDPKTVESINTDLNAIDPQGEGWDGSKMFDQKTFQDYGDVAQVEGLEVEPIGRLQEPARQVKEGDILPEQSEGWPAEVKSFTVNEKGEFVVTSTTTKPSQTTAEQINTETTAEAQAKTAEDIKPDTTDQNTNTPQTEGQNKDSSSTEDGATPGGKKEETITIKDLFKDFSWERLNEWLQTKEGRKFFLEWGAKITKMSGGVAPNRKKLTKEQIADIKKKVKEKYGR